LSETTVSGGKADPAHSADEEPHAVNGAVDIATRPTADTPGREYSVTTAR
jgi:hypothetical protein